MQIDWKASDEMVWQAREMLALLLPHERWEVDEPADVQAGLDSFKAWLAVRGHTLMLIESEEDAYHAFVVPDRCAALAVRLAADAGLTVAGPASSCL